MDSRVLKVIALMKESLHRGWSAGRAAQCVNLSPSRLHQVFKEETGLPPARYLRLLRMERARELLETSHLSVKQVMARVGVTDESHFVRDFKKSCGLTPARYRERFLGSRLDESLPPKYLHQSHVAAPGLSPRPSPVRPSPTSSAVGMTAPPLLLRRPSHPQQLRPYKSPLMLVQKRAELLSLLLLRHAAFAELTTAVTDNIMRDQNGFRPIKYRPRVSSASRRLPPAADSPRPLPKRQPRSLDPCPLPSTRHARRKA